MTTTSLKKRNNKLKREIYADVERIKESLIDTTMDLRHLLGNSYRQSIVNALQKSEALKDTASGFIANKPFKTLGVAVAAGIALGFLLKRK